MYGQRIVVGVSSSPLDWQTLAWAVGQANESGRDLVVCHACAQDSALAAPGAASRTALLELVEPALARAVSTARLRLGGDRVSVVARAMAPHDLLIQVVRASDLLVVGAPIHSGWLERRSTTHHIVRDAPCPVVVVRSTGSSGALRDRVVVGVDGSSSARAALEFGFSYAAEHRRPLAALTVNDRAETDLDGEVEPWQHKYPEVTVERFVLAGRPLETIVDASAGAALLVLGESSHSRLRQLLGSVSHGAIDRAACPVAVVGGDQRAGGMP
jgi:nucleotide-binding universal stress UspA family protein